jgi:hypothetical protein
MNPSAAGWIDKLFVLEEASKLHLIDEAAFYLELRNAGFIYGSNVASWIHVSGELSFTEEEKSKLNLILSLLYIYQLEFPEKTITESVTPILEFYKQLGAKKLSFLDAIIIGKQPHSQLEKVLHNRIQADQNIFTKNFSNIITNALLFIDVLAFRQYLKGHKDVTFYAERLEQCITNVILSAFNAKTKKSKHDKQLMKLVESSLRFYQLSTDNVFKDYKLLLNNFNSALESNYILDLACMAVWDDEVLEKKESHFIWELQQDLKLPESTVETSLAFVIAFINEHKNEISFFNQTNPVKTFYDQASKTVSVLILRNSKRLLKELKQSQELVGLLSKSTMKNLTKEEKQKVKDQLIDICKSIPSLAIFALPGGAVLLPLMIKFIPTLLPSAFDDNRINIKVQDSKKPE